MSADKIIIDQKINPIKKERARELRREMTPEEKIFWHYLRNSTLGFKFRRQQIIVGFIYNFLLHSVGLVIEFDGGILQIRQDH